MPIDEAVLVKLLRLKAISYLFIKKHFLLACGVDDSD